jgi:CheY-like chemotaxis protein
LENQPFELVQCVEEAIDIFALQAAAKNIELAYFIEHAVPRCILGDITRLRQVLVNLMNNAVKFTERGFITIEVGVAGGGASAPDEKFVLDFRVTDTGIGIPAGRIGQLFKPFTQVDSSTTRKYGGTGLGLAICDRLCQLMGGGIGVTSTPGTGSCFHFHIQSTAVGIDDVGPPLFAPIPGHGTVLAVDDHPVNRAMLTGCLQAWELTPLIASDTAGAMRLVGNIPLAAAIIDQDLAGASGLELAGELRAARPHLPIILFTPAGEGHRRNETSDILLFRLPKPIKPYALHDALRHAIVGSSGPGSDAALMTGLAIRLAESIPVNILLVEDNLVNQKVALRFLQRMGYLADAVANGLEAVQAMRERDYQLIFMDVQMPEMDGFAATREIRAKIAPERQPIIIALTANAMQGDRERCLEAGMNDYITKPVKIDDIELIIRRFFGPKPDSV